ncbi:MAG: aminotransferase class III-fold pyridoxal phosphate-dependent enzyme, partial [Merismopedia sp. SIO2A8]|nr:aminotransferase class III-fold pyridoxal phosphate-dependent enzyme [Merismopedia sp. SIO2A8]
QDLIQSHPSIFSQVRGWGLINGLVLHEENHLTSLDIVKAAMANGLLVVPAGPRVVRLVPPLIVTATEIDEAIALMQKTITQLTATV